MEGTQHLTRVARTKAASLERREGRKRELREKILRAASMEFLEQGPENFSLRRVAERIGYSATTIYLYFQNKEALLISTVEDGFKSFDRALEDAVSSLEGDAPESAVAKLEALGRAYIKFGIGNPELYRLMFMQPSSEFSMPRLLGIGSSPTDLEAADASSRQHRVVAQELLFASVREGQQSGEIIDGDPIQLADMLWAGVHGLVSLAVSPLMGPEHAEKLTEPLLATLLRGLKQQ